MSEQFQLFVGIDWAAESHEVCVLDPERRVIARKTIEHSGVGVGQLCDLLLAFQPSAVARCRGHRNPAGRGRRNAGGETVWGVFHQP
jgi:hypothetical protein